MENQLTIQSFKKRELWDKIKNKLINGFQQDHIGNTSLWFFKLSKFPIKTEKLE